MNDLLTSDNLRWVTPARACDKPSDNFQCIRSPLWLEREKRLELARALVQF